MVAIRAVKAEVVRRSTKRQGITSLCQYMEGNGQVRSSTHRALDCGRRGAGLGSISLGLWRVGRTMGNCIMERSDYNRLILLIARRIICL